VTLFNHPEIPSMQDLAVLFRPTRFGAVEVPNRG
jgi:hypothetical protein